MRRFVGAMDEVGTAVYLDYNSTSPLAPEVLETVSAALRDAWANPSSRHAAGQLARRHIENAREQVARVINGITEDIVFTSGGTESNNIVFDSVVRHWRQAKHDMPHVIINNLEHDSVAKTAEKLERDGLAEVTVVPASCESGAVSVEGVVAAIKSSTTLISLMFAQNETGVLQPVAELVKAVRKFEQTTERQQRIFIHTDAAQAIGKLKVDVQAMGVDYLTIAGHKFYGPRMGALYCRGLGGRLREDPCPDWPPLYPLLCGGGQERGLRPGTENTGLIAGLGKACELVSENLDQYSSHMKAVRDYLEQRLKEIFGEGVCINCCYGDDPSNRLPNTCNFSFTHSALAGYRVMGALECSQVSGGAACHAYTEAQPSPILLASGVARGVAANALRVSVGRDTSTSDVDLFLSDLAQARGTLLPPPATAPDDSHVTSGHN